MIGIKTHHQYPLLFLSTSSPVTSVHNTKPWIRKPALAIRFTLDWHCHWAADWPSYLLLFYYTPQTSTVFPWLQEWQDTRQRVYRVGFVLPIKPSINAFFHIQLLKTMIQNMTEYDPRSRRCLFARLFDVVRETSYTFARRRMCVCGKTNKFALPPIE